MNAEIENQEREAMQAKGYAERKHMRPRVPQNPQTQMASGVDVLELDEYKKDKNYVAIKPGETGQLGEDNILNKSSSVITVWKK